MQVGQNAYVVAVVGAMTAENGDFAENLYLLSYPFRWETLVETARQGE